MENKQSQLLKIKNELSEIKPDLVKGDIKECAESTGIGYYTISQYLSGKASHPDTGAAIVTWFKNLLNERASRVANI